MQGSFGNQTSKPRETGQTNLDDVESWGPRLSLVPGCSLISYPPPPPTYSGKLPLVGMYAFLTLLIFVHAQSGIIDIFLEIAQYFICSNPGMCFLWVCVFENFCISSPSPILDE